MKPTKDTWRVVKENLKKDLCNTYKSEPHLCAKCAFGLYLILMGADNAELSGTTVDLNTCNLFVRDSIEGKWAGDGNNRVSLSGFRTEDNGAGYWVTECPFFEGWR